jgi:hypothetical protein
MAKGGTNRHESARFSEKDEALAIALAGGCTRVEAAERAGMGLRTVFTRLKDPDFRQLVRSHRDRMTEEAYGTLARLSSLAFRELEGLILHEDLNAKIAGIRLVGTMLVRVGQFRDLIEQVAEIREALKARGR